MTSKVIDKLYKYFIWMIVGASIIAYLAYRTIQFKGDIESVATSADTWINIAFSIWLHLNIMQGANDSAITNGLQSGEFQKADELNNKIIRIINNEMKPFRDYVKVLNANERAKLEEDFFFKNGVETYEELDEKQQKLFKKLKPIIHDIYGYNLPLYYELTKDGKILYQSNYIKNKGMWQKRISKIITAILFGAMTINIAFNIGGIGEAIVSVVIMSMGMLLTFLMAFMQPYFKLRYEIPKSVILKATLYNGYVDYKNGVVSLKEITTETTPPQAILTEDKEITTPSEETPTNAANETISELITATN